MIKPRVLVIETGGTISQKRGRDGVFRPSQTPVTPRVKHLGRIADVKVEKLQKAIDSTNMITDERVMIARIIYANAHKFDGFVVIHGTDTMSETAAALTYMIQGLGKPIMLTGAQRSIFEPMSDGPTNVYAAVKAATMDFGEVGVVFGDGIHRGSRVVKEDEEGFNNGDQIFRMI